MVSLIGSESSLPAWHTRPSVSGWQIIYFFIAALKGFPGSVGVRSFHSLVLNASLSVLGMFFFLCLIAKFPTLPIKYLFHHVMTGEMNKVPRWTRCLEMVTGRKRGSSSDQNVSREQCPPLRVEVQCVQKPRDETILGIFQDHQGGQQAWSPVSQQW